MGPANPRRVITMPIQTSLLDSRKTRSRTFTPAVDGAPALGGPTLWHCQNMTAERPGGRQHTRREMERARGSNPAGDPVPERRPDHEEAVSIIMIAIAELNEELVTPVNLDLGEDAVLYGENSSLDSLGLVSLVITTEEVLEDRFDIRVDLADTRAFSPERSPFRTVRAFADHVVNACGSSL